LAALMALAALLFMLLPTVNLVNLNVSRILERASEIGVRKAFGASSRALVGQFVTENLLLTLVGGALGLLGSLGVLWLLTRSETRPVAVLHLHVCQCLQALGAPILFGMISGVY